MFQRWLAGRLLPAVQDARVGVSEDDVAWWRLSPESVIYGTPGDDTLVGTSGADTIDGGEGADEMRGGKGGDTYVVDNAGDRVVESSGKGKDTVLASVSYTLADNVENLELRGRDDLSGVGNDLANKLTGNAGHNDLDGRAGADTMVGGKGDDTYHVGDAGDVVVEKPGQGTDTVVASIDYTLGDGVENLVMRSPSTAGMRGDGNALDNTMSDWIGSDLLVGHDGNDTLHGGTVLSPGSSDTLDGGAGDDVLTAGLHAYSSDELIGGDGNDSLTVMAGANALHGGDGDDVLQGGSGGMYHGASDYLDGGAGNDTLSGGGAQSGGDGNDLMSFSIASNAEGGAGDDVIRGSGGVGYQSLWVDGGIGNDAIDVTSLNNHLTGWGGDGNDTLRGGTLVGNLSLVGGAGDDIITGYRMTPSSSVMTLSGGDGRDTITGTLTNGQCVVDGGAGDDTLQVNVNAGGFGEVTLKGGEGSDLFVMTDHQNLYPYQTWTTDFASGADHLGVSQSAISVGNGDLVIDGAVTIDGPGGFDSNAELVLVAADIFGDITLDSAAAAIGSANQAYQTGQTVLFVVDNGDQTQLLSFTSSGADAQVTADELTVVASLWTATSIAVEDLVWTT
ncbi:calcium-binding protein [Ideonella sp. DXS29W]|uniref:Calcium-binding protein n=1 Tax=Ideonella lacteola TaxID=2984193 RepID=A0ABU9BR92_9BURK